MSDDHLVDAQRYADIILNSIVDSPTPNTSWSTIVDTTLYGLDGNEIARLGRLLHLAGMDIKEVNDALEKLIKERGV